jgi:hypothetical protein
LPASERDKSSRVARLAAGFGAGQVSLDVVGVVSVFGIMDAGVMTGVVQVGYLPMLAMDDRGLTVGHLYTTFVWRQIQSCDLATDTGCRLDQDNS